MCMYLSQRQSEGGDTAGEERFVTVVFSMSPISLQFSTLGCKQLQKTDTF